MGCKNSERFFLLVFELNVLQKRHTILTSATSKESFFSKQPRKRPSGFFPRITIPKIDETINRTKLVCLGLVHENNDALSEIVLSHGDVCAPYTHPTPWLQNWPISHQHRSDNFDLHKSFALKCTWLFSRLQSFFVLKLLYLLLSALLLCLWINCSIL